MTTTEGQLGVPVKIIHEAEGHVITIETVMGEIYRGKLVEAEDNMNCQLGDVTVTRKDGSSSSLENIYIRGSKLRFIILPDMLKNAPMFRKVPTGRGRGRGSFRGVGRGSGRGGPPRGGGMGRGGGFRGGPPRGGGGFGGPR